VEEEMGMVGVVDLARQGEMGAEQVDRGRWIVLTIWVENCHAGCSDPYFDYARVHAQNWVHRQRYPHPHRRLWQSHNGLWDQDMAVGCWLVDKVWCLSCDGSWLQLCGWRNTQKRNGKRGRDVLDRSIYVTWQHNVRGELLSFCFVYCEGHFLNVGHHFEG
jgi:hypothetical protein